jgi:hypothetical protein
VLTFLDQLCHALVARDAEGIRRWLRHPLAHALPRRVRAEALAIARGRGRAFRAPIHTLHLYHQTAHLLGAISDPATRHPGPAMVTSPSQIELPLDAVA